MKYFFLLLLAVCTHLISAQTMSLIPLAKGSIYGSCVNTDPKKQGQLCYGLQYTPDTTGTLTSYTTGFFVSCTSIGAPITVNKSCTMSNQVSMQNACSESNLVLINSSGHSGSSANNKVEKDVPVILHQICFSIPLGESVTFREDEVTDLTVSIDIAGGVYVTEYPTFTQVEIKRPRYDVSKPTAFLDFKIVPLVDFTTELDWTTSKDADTDHFIIERSSDASDFITIGEVSVGETGVDKEIYQFMDKAALEGNNYYRLQQVNSRGEIEYSPIRMVT